MEMFVTPQRLLKALSFATCSLNSEHLVDALVTRLAVRRVERDDAGVCAAAVIKCARASKVHGDDPNLRRKNFLNERFETRVAADIIKHFIDSSAKKSYSFIRYCASPTRRSRSVNRGSERRLSISGLTLRSVSSYSRC